VFEGGLEVLWKIGAMMSVAFWMGVFWRGATSAGAWAATLTAFLIWLVTSQPLGANWLATIPQSWANEMVANQLAPRGWLVTSQIRKAVNVAAQAPAEVAPRQKTPIQKATLIMAPIFQSTSSPPSNTNVFDGRTFGCTRQTAS
jgi:Na+/proline symporter